MFSAGFKILAIFEFSQCIVCSISKVNSKVEKMHSGSKFWAWVSLHAFI